LVGGFEGGERIADRVELLTDIPAIIGCGDRLHNGGIVELLRIVESVTTRIARRMEMPDVVDVGLDRPYDVALHDLHDGLRIEVETYPVKTRPELKVGIPMLGTYRCMSEIVERRLTPHYAASLHQVPRNHTSLAT